MIVTIQQAVIDKIAIKDGVTLTIKAGRLSGEVLGDLASIEGQAVDLQVEAPQTTFNLNLSDGGS